jgi:hypothetical protein
MLVAGAYLSSVFGHALSVLLLMLLMPKCSFKDIRYGNVSAVSSSN